MYLFASNFDNSNFNTQWIIDQDLKKLSNFNVSLLLSLEGLLSPLALRVIQIHTASFVPSLTVVCMEAQQKRVRIPLKNLGHAVHDRSNSIFPFISRLGVSSEIISTPHLMQRYALNP